LDIGGAKELSIDAMSASPFMGGPIMNVEIEERMREEILTCALKRSFLRQKEKERLLYTQDLIDTLEEITHLPREELHSIAEEVRETYEDKGEGFFAIRHQVIFMALFALTLLGIPMLAGWLL